jgi:hypothetical protein
MNYEPGTPCVKVFFSKSHKLLTDNRGLFRLKEPWSRRFGNPAGQAEIIENDSERMYEAQAVLDKFFDAEHYMKKHDPTLPVKGRF